MVERRGSIKLILRTSGDGKQYQINALAFIAIVGGIIVWEVICAGVWWVSASGDYANLASARACYSENLQTRTADPKCSGIGPPDTYMSEVNRKARISRLTGALVPGVGIVIFLIVRRRGRTRSENA